MRLAKISQGGQIQIPAEVRHRWGTRDVIIDDAGAYIRIRPMPDDPISAAAGSLAGSTRSSADIRRQWREEEIEAEERKWARHYGRE